MVKILNNRKLYIVSIALISVLFMITRMFRLDSIPFTTTGIEYDEMYAAYDAWCIQGWGCDRDFTRYPFYFSNGGNGQSPMNTYMAAAIFKVFGFSLFNYRLVGVICAGAAYICLFLMSRRIFGDSIYSLIPNFLMTIMPYFVMSEHWGLDCYLFLSFSIIAMHFMTRAIESGHIASYILSGAAWGACCTHTGCPI